MLVECVGEQLGLHHRRGCSRGRTAGWCRCARRRRRADPDHRCAAASSTNQRRRFIRLAMTCTSVIGAARPPRTCAAVAGMAAATSRNRSGSISRPSQLVVVRADRQGDREGAVVAAEHAELQVVRDHHRWARAGPGTRRRRGARRSARSRRCRCPRPARPARRRARRATWAGASVGRSRPRPGRPRSAVPSVQRHPGDQRHAADGPARQQPDDPVAVEQPCGGVVAVGDEATEHPFEGGAAAGECDQLVVAGASACGPCPRGAWR